MRNVSPSLPHDRTVTGLSPTDELEKWREVGLRQWGLNPIVFYFNCPDALCCASVEAPYACEISSRNERRSLLLECFAPDLIIGWLTAPTRSVPLELLEDGHGDPRPTTVARWALLPGMRP